MEPPICFHVNLGEGKETDEHAKSLTRSDRAWKLAVTDVVVGGAYPTSTDAKTLLLDCS